MPKVNKRKLKHKDIIESWDSAKPSNVYGQVVFAMINKFWWPGVVVDGEQIGNPLSKSKSEWIYWYGDKRVSQVLDRNICCFRTNFKELVHKKGSKKYLKGVELAIHDCAIQDGMHELTGEDDERKWAENGFQSNTLIKDLRLSADIIKDLEEIKVLAKLDSKTTDQPIIAVSEKEDNIIQSRSDGSDKMESYKEGSAEESDASSKLSFYEDLQKNGTNVEMVCISCRDSNKTVNCQHPVFEGGLCGECKERLKTYIFALDYDGFMITCAVCAKSGELLLCDDVGCKRVYCTVCLRELACKNAEMKFKKQNPWSCMVCRGYNKDTDGCLIPKTNWWENVTKLFVSNIKHQEMSSVIMKKKRGIRVLSLFDGISTGYYALTQLGINISQYFALEIDVNAINVSKMNFSDKITQLGSVENLDQEKISCLLPLDLIIGGSPCNDLSAVNPARKGLYDHNGTGRLFFEYYRVLKTVQSLSSGPIFWFYENVASMPVEYRRVISRFLNSDPNLIDAKYFSAQHRPRFYWGNIPGMCSLDEAIPNASPSLSSAITTNCKRNATVEKLNTVTTQRNSLKPGNQHPVKMNGECSGIWITELEEVFGFPRHFTDVGNLSPQQRLGLLGKSWSVQVVVSILSSLRHFFSADKDLEVVE